MDLLRHRPLFLWCAGFMSASAGGFFLFYRRSSRLAAEPWLILVPTLAVALCGVLIGVWIGKRRIRPAVIAAVTFLLVIAGLLRSYDTFAGEDVVYLYQLEQARVSVSATVTERRGEGGFLSSFVLELASVNDVPIDGSALLTCHYPAEIEPGEIVRMSATVIPLSEAAGDGYDAAMLLGDGFVIGLLSEDETDVMDAREAPRSWRMTIERARRTLALRLNLMADGAYGLPSALLLGERGELDDAVRRDFSRAGIAHMLAISGLHMTLLFGLLEGVLRFLRVPKRWRPILLGAAAVGYLILLGFPPSATRAVFMLGMVYVSGMVRVRADPLTSLGLAGTLILAVTPYAVADAGFWMSFFSALGLIVMAPLMNRRFDQRADRRMDEAGDASAVSRRRWYGLWEGLKRGITRVMYGVFVGVIASTFTLFLVAAFIGEMGILSPVATLVLTPLCSMILLLSPLALLLYETPLAPLLGGFLRLAGRGMAAIAEWMAEPSWTVISLTHPAIVPLAIIGLLSVWILLCVRLPARRRGLILLPVLLCWLAVGGVLTADGWLTRGEMEVTYLQPSSRSDALVLVEGYEAVICDLGGGSLTSLNHSAHEASRRGATEVAVLLLTRFDSRTAGALSVFLQRETVRALWMPVPTDEEEYYRLLGCVEKAESAGVPVTLYHAGEDMTIFGDDRLTFWRTDMERSARSVWVMALDTALPEGHAERMVYCGSAVFESDLAETATRLVAEADTVIFGNCGPLPKATFGADLAFRESAAIIFSAEGQIVGYFDAASLPASVSLWRGQKRFSIS